MTFERHYSALIIACLVTVTSFVAATAYTQNRLARLDTVSTTLETNAVPSIDHLSQAAVRLTRLNQLVDDMARPGPRRASAVVAVPQELAALQREVDAYVSLSTLPGEQDFWATLRADVDRAVKLVQQSTDRQAAISQGLGTAELDKDDDAIDRALRSMLVTLEFDVQGSERMARDIRDVRATTLRAVIALDALATAIAFIGLLVAYRAASSHDRLLQQHDALLAARVQELDCFAGRVAHDVLSPLGVVSTALSMLSHSTDVKGRTYIERSQRAVKRVQQLVDDLLTFARSGAHPDPGASCSCEQVLKSVIADSQDAAADAGIQLVLQGDVSLQVRCSAGVLTSLVQNLVRNAIKYMGERPTRRIAVRLTRVGSNVHLEVEDTGPGISEHLQRVVFEAFARGPNEVAGGTGLGLAIVKRLAESHGGCVGLHSTVGVGSVFSVELPLAPTFDGRATSTETQV